MIKSIRNKIVSVLTLIACLMFALLIGVNANFAKADDAATVDTYVFSMSQTASVRTDKDPAGIRFQVELGKDKYAELAKIDDNSSKESLDFVITVDKTGNTDQDEERKVTHTVNADSFKNSDVIKLMFTITFKDVSAEDLQKAYAMNLTAECYVVNGAGTTVYAKGSGVAQDMRSVASFNVLLDGDAANPALEGYYGELDVASNQAQVASYAEGTEGVKIAVAGLTGTDYDVYIDTYLVESAQIADGIVTISDDDMPALSSASKHYIQLFNASGNVIAKEITDEVEVYNTKPIAFSAMDGVLDFTEIFGNEEVTAVEVIESAAEQTSTVALANGKITGIDTLNYDWTAVSIKLSTAYSAKIVNLSAATKIIDEASDLSVFQITPHSYATETVYKPGTETVLVSVGESLGSNAITGYYVLANDIDAKDLTLKHAFYSNNPYPSSAGDDGGFRGVLDGQGFAISNFTAPSCGLFGRIDVRSYAGCGVIKNVAFINASVSSEGYIQLLSHHAMAPTIENVYIDFQVTERGGYVLFGNGAYNANVTNLVVNARFGTNVTAVTGTYYGLTDLYSSNVSKTFASIENSFIMGDLPISYESSLLAVAGNSTDTSESIKLRVEGVKAYDDAAAMSKDAAANAESLEAFNRDYWMIVNGVPVWKSVADFVITTDCEDNTFDSSIEITVTNSNINQEIENVIITADSDKVYVEGNVIKVNPVYNITSIVEIPVTVKATVDGVDIEKSITVTLTPAEGESIKNVYIEADGTIVGLAADKMSLLENITLGETAIAAPVDGKLDLSGIELTLGEYYTLITISGNKMHSIKFRYVTKAIDEAEDLSVFVLKAKDTTDYTLGCQDVDGYYVLTKHIDASDYTPAKHTGFYKNYAYSNVSYDHGFIGTLDGQGYAISNLTTVSNGLFGVIAGDEGAVIKNIAFINAKTSTTGNYAVLLAHHLWYATLENVYIEVSEMGVGSDGTSSILSNNSVFQVTMNNVVINVTAKAEDQIEGKYYRLAGSINGDEIKVWNTGTWTNFYTIADLAFAVRDKSKDLTIASADDLVGHTLNAAYASYVAGQLVDPEIAAAIWATKGETATSMTVKVKDDRVFTASNVSEEIAKTYTIYGYKYWSQWKIATGIKSYVDTTAMTADAAANATSLEAMTATGYFTVTDGVPAWANLPAAE